MEAKGQESRSITILVGYTLAIGLIITCYILSTHFWAQRHQRYLRSLHRNDSLYVCYPFSGSNCLQPQLPYHLYKCQYEVPAHLRKFCLFGPGTFPN